MAGLAFPGCIAKILVPCETKLSCLPCQAASMRATGGSVKRFGERSVSSSALSKASTSIYDQVKEGTCAPILIKATLVINGAEADLHVTENTDNVRRVYHRQ
ncbi:hypothetical protein EJB05_19409, partial [Eragrostis curvula]